PVEFFHRGYRITRFRPHSRGPIGPARGHFCRGVRLRRPDELRAPLGAHLLGWLAVALYAGAEALSIGSLMRPRAALSRAVPGLIARGPAPPFAALRRRAERR